MKREVICFLLFLYFDLLYDASLAWIDVAPIKSRFLVFSPKNLTQDRYQLSQSEYLLVLSLPTKPPYFTTLTFKVCLFVKISLFMHYMLLQSFSIMIIGEMKFSSSRWKLHCDWTLFLTQSPINITSFAVFSENGYRYDFWIDKKIEHLNVLGKTDGIFVLSKTPSEWKQFNWWQDSWDQPNYVQFLCLFLFIALVSKVLE